MSQDLSPSPQRFHEWSKLVGVIHSAYPDLEAVYRFGSAGTDHERIESDVDLAVLLPCTQAKAVDLWDWATLNGEIAANSHNDRVDLINLREVDVLFQFEILRTGDVILDANKEARLNFEVLTISKYQELKAWRTEIEQAALSGELYSARP